MSANNLLFWMSARRHGSWPQFRAAVEELHIDQSDTSDGVEEDSTDQFAMPLYHILRFNLQRLGHAEFFTGNDNFDWQITPPSLAVTARANDYLGILAGARSMTVLERVHEVAQVSSHRTPLPGYPDQLLMTTHNIESLRDVATRAGLHFQLNAPEALLMCLPAIDDAAVRRSVELPFGSKWKAHRFLSDGLRWQPSSLDEASRANGSLFNFTQGHQRHVLFCDKGMACRIPMQVGKYLVLRRRRRWILRYNRFTRILEVPAICRPPFLIERALILCSGLPPTSAFDGGKIMLYYTDIPQPIAQIASGLLRQEFR